VFVTDPHVAGDVRLILPEKQSPSRFAHSVFPSDGGSISDRAKLL
jgi:hypothetical protein